MYSILLGRYPKDRTAGRKWRSSTPGVHAFTEKDVRPPYTTSRYCWRNRLRERYHRGIRNSAALLENEPDAWYVLGKAYQKRTIKKKKRWRRFEKAEENILFIKKDDHGRKLRKKKPSCLIKPDGYSGNWSATIIARL